MSIAAYFGYKKIAELLVGKGVDLESRDEFGWTALILACYYGRTTVAKYLVELGANLEAGEVSIDLAMHRKGHLKIT